MFIVLMSVAELKYGPLSASVAAVGGNTGGEGEESFNSYPGIECRGYYQWSLRDRRVFRGAQVLGD